MKGRFISLEGGEGAGKSTQARRVAESLAERGIPAIVTREPGGSDGAEAIRALLMHGEVARWSPCAEALLFAAARADHVERTIAPALAAGQWVISDRYVDSTRAYQGAQGIEDGDIVALHRFGCGGLLPDRTFLLQLSPEAGIERASARDRGTTDRFGMRGPKFHSRVWERFAEISASEPERIRRVDASGDADSVTRAIMAGLADLLP